LYENGTSYVNVLKEWVNDQKHPSDAQHCNCPVLNLNLFTFWDEVWEQGWNIIKILGQRSYRGISAIHSPLLGFRGTLQRIGSSLREHIS
jgi:hypothetical protein